MRVTKLVEISFDYVVHFNSEQARKLSQLQEFASVATGKPIVNRIPPPSRLLCSIDWRYEGISSEATQSLLCHG